MNSYQSHADMGGTAQAGRIQPEPEGHPFHSDWERQVLALTLATGYTGQWNIDISRSAREQLPKYASLSYYQIWFEALCKLLQERGLLSAQELQSGVADAEWANQANKPMRVLAADQVQAVLSKGGPTQRPATQAARFSVGSAVRTQYEACDHHTRLPAYARGRLGTVERIHGVHVFADSHAQGLGEAPTWLYRVRFDGQELWAGKGSAASVCLDLWEPYLMPHDE